MTFGHFNFFCGLFLLISFAFSVQLSFSTALQCGFTVFYTFYIILISLINVKLFFNIKFYFCFLHLTKCLLLRVLLDNSLCVLSPKLRFRKLYHPFKRFPCVPSQSISYSHRKPITSKQVLPVLELQINRHIQYVLICVWLLHSA